MGASIDTMENGRRAYAIIAKDGVGLFEVISIGMEDYLRRQEELDREGIMPICTVFGKNLIELEARVKYVMGSLKGTVF